MHPDLFQHRQPNLFLAEMPAGSFHRWGHALQTRHPDAVVRVLRGQKCKTAPALFDEWSAALQFSHYSAPNWPAFEENLMELRSLRPMPHLLLLTYGHDVLADDGTQDFKDLFEIILRVNTSWKKPSPLENAAPQAFNLVIQETRPSCGILGEKLAANGLAFETLDPSCLLPPEP